jgi:hypothetical protein
MNDETQVSPEEIKAFMNEPETAKAPEPMGLDDWAPADEVKDYKLTTEQIAHAAFHSLSYYAQSNGVPLHESVWSSLSDEMRQHYVSKVAYFTQTAANPNGYEECAKMHDLVLEVKLKNGWSWGETYSEDARTDPNLLPYRALPMHEKVKDFLFRNVVISLLQVWKGH